MRNQRRFFRHSPAHRQRGGVTLLLVMVLIVLAALVGVLAVRGATSDLQMAGSQRVSRTGFYCAESALNQARALVGANPKDWAGILNKSSTPSWWTGGDLTNGMQVDIDGDGKVDALVKMSDNVDETPNDFTRDNDLTVILTSTCTSAKYEPNGATRTLSQLVTYDGSNGPTDYRFQAGHSSTHSGNTN